MRDAPILHGARLRLRPPHPGDKADRRSLGRDPGIVRMFGGGTGNLPPLTDTEIDAWYDAVAADPHGWMIEHAGRCIGTARLHSLDLHDRRARYAVGILEPALLGQGLGAEVTRLVLAHAFDTLRLHRVDLRVLAYNERAIRCYEKCGFVREGIERQSALIDGAWYDDIMMAVLEDEWRAPRPAGLQSD